MLQEKGLIKAVKVNGIVLRDEAAAIATSIRTSKEKNKAIGDKIAAQQMAGVHKVGDNVGDKLASHTRGKENANLDKVAEVANAIMHGNTRGSYKHEVEQQATMPKMYVAIGAAAVFFVFVLWKKGGRKEEGLKFYREGDNTGSTASTRESSGLRKR
jgi:hypothetical protein